MFLKRNRSNDAVTVLFAIQKDPKWIFGVSPIGSFHRLIRVTTKETWGRGVSGGPWVGDVPFSFLEKKRRNSTKKLKGSEKTPLKLGELQPRGYKGAMFGWFYVRKNQPKSIPNWGLVVFSIDYCPLKKVPRHLQFQTSESVPRHSVRRVARCRWTTSGGTSPNLGFAKEIIHQGFQKAAVWRFLSRPPKSMAPL